MSLYYYTIIFLIFSHYNPLWSQTVQESLRMANENEKELAAVLKHYKNTGENLKYRAAQFLIEHMPIHESRIFEWVSSEKGIVPFSEFEYPDFSEALTAHKKLKDSLGIRARMVRKPDIHHVSANLLIQNIDAAFKAWQHNSWSQSYDFNTFCEYILPHRSLVEPLEPWRAECAFLVNRASNNLVDSTDPVEVCTNVLNELKGFTFKFEQSAIPAPLLGTQQLLFRREGSCPELANLALLASRAIGLAVTFDFTPHYAASSNRHYWNTIIDKDGNPIPFNGSGANDLNGTPYNYDAAIKRMAKVMRQTYSVQNNALATKKDRKSIPYGFLWYKNIIDVTKTYVPVGTIHFRFPSDTIDLAYLNVFNRKKWLEVHWAEKKDSVFTFTDMGTDIVYLPSYYSNFKTTYTSYPILLDEKGVQHSLKPDFDNAFDCMLSRDNELKTKYILENNSLQIESDEMYSLFYWSGKWKKLATAKATLKGVHFSAVPANALFLLLPKNHDGFERIFTITPKTHKINWY